jgi:hypothetical protein
MQINQGVIAGKNFDDIVKVLSHQEKFIWYQPIAIRLATKNEYDSLYKKKTVEDCLKDMYIDSNGNIILTNKLDAYKKDKENNSLNFYSFEARCYEELRE